MITLVFATDRARVVGGSTVLRNLWRMPFLPFLELAPAMNSAMTGDYAVMGGGSVGFYGGRAQNYRLCWLLTSKPDHPAASRGLTLCHDPNDLIARFRDSEDELLVLGGNSLWQRFLPAVSRLRVVETHALVPGDLVFDAWDDGSFTITSEQPGRKLTRRDYARSLAPAGETR